MGNRDGVWSHPLLKEEGSKRGGMEEGETGSDAGTRKEPRHVTPGKKKRLNSLIRKRKAALFFTIQKEKPSGGRTGS